MKKRLLFALLTASGMLPLLCAAEDAEQKNTPDAKPAAAASSAKIPENPAPAPASAAKPLDMPPVPAAEKKDDPLPTNIPPTVQNAGKADSPAPAPAPAAVQAPAPAPDAKEKPAENASDDASAQTDGKSSFSSPVPAAAPAPASTSGRTVALPAAVMPGKPAVQPEEKPAADPRAEAISKSAAALGGSAEPADSSGNSDMFAEKISISTGEKRVLNVSFRIDSCKSNSANVKIEHVSSNSLEISGEAPGHAEITVSAGGLEKQYMVTVFNSTLQTYQELKRLMEELPEVTPELYDGGLVLRGVITQPVHWTYFRRIMVPYEDSCKNYVSFMPDAKLFAALKKQLEDAGFPVEEKSGPDYPGKLAFRVDGNVLTVTGNLLSERDIQSVQTILSSQNWLNPEWNGQNFGYVTDFAVAPTQIDLGVVFVGVNRTQLKRLGNSSANGTVLTWDVIAWFKALYGGLPDAPTSGGDTNAGTSVLLSSNLKGSLLFFGNNGITDFRDAGHITLTNNGEESSFENGGTRSVKIYGRDTANLKEINFGLKYKAKALLQGNGIVRLDLDLERGLPPIRDGEDYIQRKSRTKTSLQCPLGKTAVIAGQKELTFTKNGPAGYAFLRHVPILNWFASFEEDSGEQVQILILVSPELMHQNLQLSARPSQENSTVEDEVSEVVNEGNQQVHENEQKSWFMRMFTW